MVHLVDDIAGADTDSAADRGAARDATAGQNGNARAGNGARGGARQHALVLMIEVGAGGGRKQSGKQHCLNCFAQNIFGGKHAMLLFCFSLINVAHSGLTHKETIGKQIVCRRENIKVWCFAIPARAA
jgi:hypothetical protein